MFVRTNRFFILGVGEKRSLNQSSRVPWTIDAEFPLQAGIKCDLVDFAQKGRAKYIWVQAHAVSSILRAPHHVGAGAGRISSA